MSLDGKWIRKHESKEFQEGPFVEQDIEKLRADVRKKFYRASILLKVTLGVMEQDTKDLIFTDESDIVNRLDLLASTYKLLCSYSQNNVDSLIRSNKAFERLIPQLESILDEAKSMYNLLGKAYYGNPSETYKEEESSKVI